MKPKPTPEEVGCYHKPVEPLPKSTEQSRREARVGETSQGGHFHADGTWHRGTHHKNNQPKSDG